MTNKIDNPLISDDAILAELGARLAARRIDMTLTQAALAREAGVSKRTVERVENGASTQMSSIIRIFRALKLLDVLEQLIPPRRLRPMDLLQRAGKERQRVSRTAADEEALHQVPWTWKDES